LIKARLHPAAKAIAATEVTTYTSKSPGQLPRLSLQLAEGIYREDARASVTRGRREREAFTDGWVVEDLQRDQGDGWTKAGLVGRDLRMQVNLVEPLGSGGLKLRIRIAYHYAVPEAFGGRTSWVDTRNGPILDIASRYPRMVVYDNVCGAGTPSRPWPRGSAS
jgi:hypothetical protein